MIDESTKLEDRTAGGHEYRIVKFGAGKGDLILGEIYQGPIGDAWKAVHWYQKNGLAVNDVQAIDLVIAKHKPVTEWVNVYPDGSRTLNSSKEEADRAACFDRIACKEITYNPGEGLE